MPRIAISGSFGTGKTTLINNLETKLPKLKETAREVISEIGLNPRLIQSDQGLKFNFQKKILEKQIKKESEYSDFIIDRSIFDSFAFCGNLLPHQKNILYQIILDNYKPYDLIVYLPVTYDIPLVDDNTRLLSRGFQEEVDLNLRELYKINKIDYFLINQTDFITRKNRIQKLINKYA